MEYALKERIGKPELFVGRKEELAYFLKWTDGIKQEKSRSTALLARRKMGKTALMERLFNITFDKNDGVIPFYYEIKERSIWIVDFCIDFCLTFVYQYMAFKTRNPRYLIQFGKSGLEKAKQLALTEGLDVLAELIEGVEHAVQHNHVDLLWEIVREAPKTIAARQDEFIAQMIDEFQFLNAMVYWDKGKKKPAHDLAGGYLSTAESKIAPLLVTGSWVGWLMNELSSMLPARFRNKYLKNMPENEASEMLYKFSRFFEVPVTEETAYMLIRLTEGSPFYLSAVIQSDCPGKDLTTLDGLAGVLEFETLDDEGIIKSTWMEYIAAAFPQINERNAKNIVLHLCKHRDREVTRKELLDQLNLDMTDGELERKLKALVKADIINQGKTNYDYRGVKDNIFDKVFRGVYEKEIREFDVSVIKKEYGEELEKIKKQYNSLLGKYNYHMGYFAEYSVLDRLRLHAGKENDMLKSITRYLPSDFNFCEYTQVWKYHSSPKYAKSFSVDIFARAGDRRDYSIIGEVKSRESKKFSLDEVRAFEGKFAMVKELEKVERAVGFLFSRCGFTKDAEAYCRKQGIAVSEDQRWLGS